MLESIEMIELRQFPKYKKLLTVLISLFVKGVIKEEYFDLNEEELQILKTIIYKKFKKHIDITLDKPSLILKLVNICQKVCLKKNEEKWKFIYKKTIKSLKNNFNLNNVQNNTKPSMDDFLQYYFGECASLTQTPLNYYKDPLIEKYNKRNMKDKKNIDSNCPKSINTKFLKYIFQSPHFVQDFFEYINSKFKEEYLNEIPEKFFLIFKNYVNNSKNIKSSKEYFQNNKRCKLPWTFHDVNLAIQSMQEINKDIQKLSK